MRNTKYILSYGVAFNEKNEMLELSNYAKRGWLLEKISFGGLFYKLRKDKPQDIQYSLDYQADPDEDYLKMFSEAGWNIIFSNHNYINIFAAKKGTPPIYVDDNSEVEKYIEMKNMTQKGVLYSLIMTLISFILLSLSNNYFPKLNSVCRVLFVISISIGTIFFSTFSSYNSRCAKKKKIEIASNSNVMKIVFWLLFILILIIIYIDSIVGSILLFLLFAMQSIGINKERKE